jgi:hypothetical protein
MFQYESELLGCWRCRKVTLSHSHQAASPPVRVSNGLTLRLLVVVADDELSSSIEQEC